MPRKKRANRLQRLNRQMLGNIHTITNTAFVAPLRVAVTNTGYPFTSVVVKLNRVGLASLGFGWLAKQMECYDLYRIDNLQMTWVPSLSDHASGTVCMYYDPDPSATKPTSFEQLSGNAQLKSCKATRQMSWTVPHSRMNRLPWYETKATSDTGCAGCLVLAITEGSIPLTNTASVAVGYLKVIYKFTLKNPTNSVGGAASVTQQLIEQSILDELEEVRQLLQRNQGSIPGDTLAATNAIKAKMDALYERVQFLTEKVWHCTTNFKTGTSDHERFMVVGQFAREVVEPQRPASIPPVVQSLENELKLAMEARRAYLESSDSE